MPRYIMRGFVCFSCGLVIATVSSAGAFWPQVKLGFPATSVERLVEPPVPGDQQVSAAAGAPSGAPGQANSVAQSRMQKIQQLMFDRRPSAILRAWSLEAAPLPAEPAKAPAADGQPAAAQPDQTPGDAPNAADAPAADAPASDVPATDAPATDAPATDAPATDAPATDAPATDAPATDAPATDAPAEGSTPAEGQSPAEGAADGGTPQAGSPAQASGAPAAKPAEDPLAVFDKELQQFSKDVTLSNWARVKSYLASLSEEEGKALYLRLLQALQSPMANIPTGLSVEVQQQLLQFQQMQNQQNPGQPEVNLLTLEDLMALLECSPKTLDDALVGQLGSLVRLSIESGSVPQVWASKLQEAVSRAEQPPLTERQAAHLLFAAGQDVLAGDFLPEAEQAIAGNDYEGLNLLSRYFLARHAQEQKSEFLEQAWQVTQAVLASGQATLPEQEKALARAVELTPSIREELGEAWLHQSFTDKPERGIRILAAIGAETAESLMNRPQDPDGRLRSLKLQHTAVTALLKSAPEQAQNWQSQLSLLAGNWLKEATLSYSLDQSTSYGPALQRDMYGNIFYSSDFQQQNYGGFSNQARPIQVGELLEIKPTLDWLALVNAGLQPKFSAVVSQLYLKVGDEEQAWPHIESLAATQPALAKNLVNEFLRVWTENHNPNAVRDRTSYYMFMYGFERRAESIPLTRSKQERNLVELADLVSRLRKLPLEKVDEHLLSTAFTTCHSSAEVYRVESIEKVFGSLDGLEPMILAELIQQMRANLAGLWRVPAVQEQNQTRRRPKDIQAEVLRGYEVAKSVIARGQEKYPDHWALQLAKASLEHDEINYQKEVDPDSEYTERRKTAFDGFKKAAELYAAQVQQLPEEEQTTLVFDQWFYASLGACDLQDVDELKTPDTHQPALIKEAILKLPQDASDRHMTQFATALFARMSAVKPVAKFRYAKGGLEIVGDHKNAAEARKVYDFYMDLVNEIQVRTRMDGSDVIGHGQPFGVYVEIRHTRDIERESGGFGRYLQNQNNGNYFYYNYGRPLENYRDKFEKIVKDAMEEHYEVLSVTFESEDVTSRADPEFGWRVTPYAYLLLKPRGPEIDKLPPVHLDFDFLDTSGYVLLPIESAALALDASSPKGDGRPFSKLKITQTLDERQSEDGKLLLEIKATAQGLVPELSEILSVSPVGFNITATDDQGLSVSRFDAESPEPAIISERSWVISLEAQPGQTKRPESFAFGSSPVEVEEMVYQRYQDADMQTVESTIALQSSYGKVDRKAWWIGGATAAAALGLLALIVIWWSRRRPAVRKEELALPGALTPFTVLGFCRSIQSSPKLSDSKRQELAATVEKIERHYFGRTNGENIDLDQIAKRWLEAVR